MSTDTNWYVYILECADSTLYTGVAKDLQARIGQHNNGEGAKYTRGRLPVRLAYQETAKDRSQAQSREASIKKLSRLQKLGLCS